MMVYARRDLAAGERVTFNYGPDELVHSWRLPQRRAYLLEKLGFVCQCARCVAEEAAAGGRCAPAHARPARAAAVCDEAASSAAERSGDDVQLMPTSLAGARVSTSARHGARSADVEQSRRRHVQQAAAVVAVAAIVTIVAWRRARGA